MAGDGSGVDVVLTKWSYKGLQDTSVTCIKQQGYKFEDGMSCHSIKWYLSKNRKIDWAPSVSPPVNKSRRKVCSEYSCNWEVQRLRGWGEKRIVVFQFSRCYLQILSRMYHKCPKWKLASRWMKLKAMREKQRMTLIHSWHLLPKRDSMCQHSRRQPEFVTWLNIQLMAPKGASRVFDVSNIISDYLYMLSPGQRFVNK